MLQIAIESENKILLTVFFGVTGLHVWIWVKWDASAKVIFMVDIYVFYYLTLSYVAWGLCNFFGFKGS